ncbi:cytochrome P450 [Hypoxylon sp. NC1633]|nr:cytochrome P450 [Hypoxylon sp. NC1633]
MAPTLPDASYTNFALLGAAVVTVYAIGSIFYNLFLHPLRSYPGPILWRATHFPRVYHLIKGDLPFVAAKLFAKYGTVVRVSPISLVYCDPQAWKDIYGHRTTGAPEIPKYQKFYRTVPIPVSIITAERHEHSLVRRQLAHGFSDKAMREQEGIIGSYVNLLIRRLYENGKDGTVALNMHNWFNWTTFDVIGDLGFGSSFGSLENSSYHPWVKIITHNMKMLAVVQGFVWLGLRFIFIALWRSGLMESEDEHFNIIRNRLAERIKLGYKRPDFIEGLIKKKDEWQMDFERLVANSSVLIIAGSETTATLLTGAVFLLTTRPEVLAKLNQEVRSSFKSEDEITLTSVGELHYMLACLNEALRRYPPVTGDLPRVTPKGGATIVGKHVPEGTAVTVWQWPINHDPRLWTEPMKYAPERWLGDPKYSDDQIEAMQPFSYGPRNCIGRNLAYAEMRLILAKIIFNFDMELSEDSRGWLEGQRAYVVWDKPPLNVYLKPVAKKAQ